MLAVATSASEKGLHVTDGPGAVFGGWLVVQTWRMASHLRDLSLRRSLQSCGQRRCSPHLLMAKGVEWTATLATASRKGKGQAKSSKDEHTERRRVHP